MSANNNTDLTVPLDGETGSPPHGFQTYEAFFPYYVAMHSQPATRLVHAVGTITAGLVALSGLLRFRPKLKRVLAAPLIGYGAAWASHFLIEHNNPATFGYPAWSFRGDLDILSMMLQGQDDELTEIAQEWLASHPEDRSPGSLPVEEEVV